MVVPIFILPGVQGVERYRDLVGNWEIIRDARRTVLFIDYCPVVGESSSGPRCSSSPYVLFRRPGQGDGIYKISSYRSLDAAVKGAHQWAKTPEGAGWTIENIGDCVRR